MARNFMCKSFAKQQKMTNNNKPEKFVCVNQLQPSHLTTNNNTRTFMSVNHLVYQDVVSFLF